MPGGGGGAEVGSLKQLVTIAVRCWTTYDGRTNEDQGCYRFDIPNQLSVNGNMVQAIGNDAALVDLICDDYNDENSWTRRNGFAGNDINVIEDLFGCGGFIFNLPNWVNPQLPAGRGPYCMYYTPRLREFNFDRESIYISECTTNYIR